MGLDLDTLGGSLPKPHILEVIALDDELAGEVNQYEARGIYFTPDLILSTDLGTITDFEYIHGELIRFEYFTNVDTSSYFKVENTSGSHQLSDIFVYITNPFTDYRTGGFNYIDGTDIIYKNNTTLNRDSEGIYQAGGSNWGNYVRLNHLEVLRNTNSTFEVIFNTDSNPFMVGIGSTASRNNNNTQYSDAEVVAYFNSSTNFWGLYGNDGRRGRVANQQNQQSFNSTWLKVKFTNSGSQGGLFTLYSLTGNTPAEWLSEDSIITSFTIGGSLDPDETNIFPTFLTNGDGLMRVSAARVY